MSSYDSNLNYGSTENGPFGLCRGIWDPDSNKYNRATETQIAKCCLNTNFPTIQECYHQCSKFSSKPEHTKCVEKCNRIAEISEANCQLSSSNWGTNNSLYKALEDFNCDGGYYRPVDIKCLEDNKEDILKKCRRICTQSSTMDCTQHCKFMYNIIRNPDVTKMRDTTTYKTSIRSRTCNTVYIGYSLGCAVILLGIWIIIRGKIM